MSTSMHRDEDTDCPPMNKGPYVPVTFCKSPPLLTKYRSTSLTKEYPSVHSFLASTCTPGGLLRLLGTASGLAVIVIVASRDGPNGVGELWFNVEQTNLIRLGLRRALIEGGVASPEAREIEGDHWEDKGAEAAYPADSLTLVPFSTSDTASSSTTGSNSTPEEGQLERTTSSLGRAPLPAAAASGGFGQAVFTSQAALDRALKAIKKQLDRVGSNKALDGFSKMRDAWAIAKKHKARVVALDVETWEHNHDVITEVGVTLVEAQSGRLESRHYIIEENQKRRNGRWVKDRRDYFSFGDSQTLPERSLSIILQRLLLPSPTPAYPILLILHAPSADLDALAALDVDVLLFHKTLEPLLRPRLSSTPGTFILDTQALFRGWSKANSQPTVQQVGQEPKLISLGDAVERVGLAPGESLHNAGNDAYYTWKVFECMMNKDDVVRTGGGAGQGQGQVQRGNGQSANDHVKNGGPGHGTGNNGRGRGKATPTPPPTQQTRRIPGLHAPAPKAHVRTGPNAEGWGARPVVKPSSGRRSSGGWNVPDGSENAGQGW
ncbi:BZ3500_MvSof-1268-A1-R1_Chr1-2g01316 [Microbotryum saponariae]|uniref:BZ3500_MvSof-1268-A1-R1_Chr1-2g01316 protein n=1 Tax=Microbotryum saponariae TaxID=289078 RepID=A0A2X0KXC3_9BASI|nr:BZ3500_MvSof-1268-A1-R1_Chr1-2g01316 [Microbotryum saponariae]SCZ97078.1 BZ3501_MvSof-1269-A2-R1_Chr1-2g00915 [Microbotryum saponariae]